MYFGLRTQQKSPFLPFDKGSTLGLWLPIILAVIRILPPHYLCGSVRMRSTPANWKILLVMVIGSPRVAEHYRSFMQEIGVPISLAKSSVSRLFELIHSRGARSYSVSTSLTFAARRRNPKCRWFYALRFLTHIHPFLSIICPKGLPAHEAVPIVHTGGEVTFCSLSPIPPVPSSSVLCQSHARYASLSFSSVGKTEAGGRRRWPGMDFFCVCQKFFMKVRSSKTASKKDAVIVPSLWLGV